jgi:hypothetical protein
LRTIELGKLRDLRDLRGENSLFSLVALSRFVFSDGDTFDCIIIISVSQATPHPGSAAFCTSPPLVHTRAPLERSSLRETLRRRSEDLWAILLMKSRSRR